MILLSNVIGGEFGLLDQILAFVANQVLVAQIAVVVCAQNGGCDDAVFDQLRHPRLRQKGS